MYFILDSTALTSSGLSGIGSSVCYTDLTEECPCSSPRELAPESREELCKRTQKDVISLPYCQLTSRDKVKRKQVTIFIERSHL